ncbi:hypothetical protein DV737_g2723, partial [Chaetothyriales sp. CBS 132003]
MPKEPATNGGPDASSDSGESSGESEDWEQSKEKRSHHDVEGGDEDSAASTHAQFRYQVERIVKHKKSAGGILYNIKWHGYPDSENTWEPEENLLPHSRDALQQYFDQNGGEDKVKAGLKKAKPEAKSASKSASKLASKSVSKSAASSKRSTPLDAEPAAKRRKAEDEPPKTWTPKTHDWTPDVDKIELIERDETGQLQVYIRFTRNRLAKVSMDAVKKHCPVPMLDFFQAHLKFKPDDGEDAGAGEEGDDDD